MDLPKQDARFKNYGILLCTMVLTMLGCKDTGYNKSSIDNYVNIQDSKSLLSDFKSPPASAKPWAFWWWLEGNISEAGILRDLKAMKKVGLGGAIIFDAGSSNYNQVRKTESGPPFMGKKWQELFVYAVRTADSLDLGLSMNIGSGWNDGGPWVTPELSAKKIIWSHQAVEGPKNLDKQIKVPDGVFTDSDSSNPYFKQIVVLAIKRDQSTKDLPPLKNFELKAVHRLMNRKFSQKGGYDWEVYLQRDPLKSDQGYDAKLDDIINITDRVDDDGHINWEVPDGKFDIYRFGYTGTGAKVSTYSPGGGGLAIDYMSAKAMDLQFDHTVGKLLPKVKPYIGKGLKYLHDDSWELGVANWTPDFISKFKEQHGYDPAPYLPILTGKIIGNRDVSNRFLYDYRRTIADLIAKNHYERFRTLAHQHHLGLHPESGGPHPAPIDGLKNLGISDIPMGEFWARVKTHRVADYERIFVKQSASAAHIYGKKLVQAEGPTSIGPQWEMDPQHMKPTLDRAFCEGLNRLVFHTFTHSPKSAGKPGNEYFAGTHFNPNITWWNQAPALVNYVSRIQFMLQQGKFVGDILYYYGDNVPNQVSLKRVQPGPDLPEGYDYDVANTEVILKRMSVKNHRIYLPDGKHYEILVLPDRKTIPLDVLKKLEKMAKQGATIVGPKPQAIPGLENYKQADAQVKAIAEKMWGNIDGEQIKEHSYGDGKVIWGKSIQNILLEKQVIPDFTYKSNNNAFIDYIHRKTADTDIYYLVNRKNKEVHFKASFRIDDKIPERWNPADGEVISQPIYTIADGRLNMPVHLGPDGSVLIVFRHSNSGDQHITSVTWDSHNIFPSDLADYNKIPQFSGDKKLQFFTSGTYQFETSSGKKETFTVDTIPQHLPLNGSWVVHFSSEWGGPDSVVFKQLTSWPENKNRGIKYYSGTAVYRKHFKIDPEILKGDYKIELNLGAVYNLAEVIVNGKNIGVLWNKPFKADITNQVHEGKNLLAIKVVNLWPNRIIGDQFLPESKRYTQTNVTKFTRDYPLLKSGLLGPVILNFYPEKKIRM